MRALFCVTSLSLTLMLAPASALAQDIPAPAEQAVAMAGGAAPLSDSIAQEGSDVADTGAAIDTDTSATAEISTGRYDHAGHVAAEAAADAEVVADSHADAQADAGEGVPGLIGLPPEGKGQVVFFRPAKFAGAAIGFKVREGETELGKLRSGKYFVHVAAPGVHEYTVHSEAKDVLTLEVEAGETYYVQGTITMGLMVGRPNLAPSEGGVFDGMSAKLSLAE